MKEKKKTKMVPKIEASIIIPTLNEEEYIGKTLESLANQTFKNFEVIIVDSNSKDRTREIARSFKKKLNIRVFNIKRKGFSLARNFGASKAKSNLLIFIDADTIIGSDVIEKVIKEFKKDKKLVCLTSTFSSYDTRDSIEKLMVNLSSILIRILHFFGINHFPGFFLCCRKKVFDKIRFDESLKYCEDVDLSKKMKKFGETKIGDFKVYTSCRRIHKRGKIGITIEYIKGALLFHIKKIAPYSYKPSQAIK